jgi:hypothetical protein
MSDLNRIIRNEFSIADNLTWMFEELVDEVLSIPLVPGGARQSASPQTRTPMFMPQPRTPFHSGFTTPLVERNVQRFDTLDTLRDLEDMMSQWLETLAHQTEQTWEDVKVTLSENEFSKLNTYVVKEGDLPMVEDKDCHICIETLAEKGLEITTLPCNHSFHTPCIRVWLQEEKVSCPVCREDVRSSI